MTRLACLRRILPVLSTACLSIAAAMPPVGESPFPDAPPGFDLGRVELQQFMTDMQQRHAFNRYELNDLLASAVPQRRILELISRPAERVAPWHRYRANFLTEERITAGGAFWQEHRDSLARASAGTGVPTAYIVAIIGVETFYGRITGNWRVLDALMTLGFDYPPRANFFRSELENLLLLAREEGLDAATLRGSYAGAMGPPQFMPSSYRRYAADGDADGKRNLLTDWDDVIASVARYFQQHGWRSGEPVLIEASAPADLFAALDFRNLELNETLATLRGKRVVFASELPAGTACTLLPAELADGPSVRIGFNNFRVITRYNRSIRYAMAVHDLATELARRTAASP